MKKIFIDTDIILDLLLERDPFYEFSSKLFIKVENKEIEGYVSSLIFSNLFYIIRKIKGIDEAKIILRKLKYLVNVLAINDKIIELSLDSNFSDFEDGIQYYVSLENNLDIIITRNKDDYKYSKIPVFTAEEYLDIYK